MGKIKRQFDPIWFMNLSTNVPVFTFWFLKRRTCPSVLCCACVCSHCHQDGPVREILDQNVLDNMIKVEWQYFKLPYSTEIANSNEMPFITQYVCVHESTIFCNV